MVARWSLVLRGTGHRVRERERSEGEGGERSRDSPYTLIGQRHNRGEDIRVRSNGDGDTRIGEN
jgi:hypothetical protein